MSGLIRYNQYLPVVDRGERRVVFPVPGWR
jgi:hypothetical protein